jgi:hypothetical protein
LLKYNTMSEMSVFASKAVFIKLTAKMKICGEVIIRYRYVTAWRLPALVERS